MHLKILNGFFYLDIPYQDEERRARAKRIPGYRYRKGRGWEWHANPETWENLKEVFHIQEHESWNMAGYFGALEEVKHGIHFYKSQPRKYQREGILWGLQKGSHLNTDEMGLGKTFQALIQVQYYLANGICPYGWVVCSKEKGILTWKWLAEVEKHTNLSAHIIEGPKRKRLELLERKSDIRIINYDLLRLHKEELQKGTKGCVVVGDEIPAIKNIGSSERSAVMFAWEDKIRIGLTGTPIENTPKDLFGILQWVSRETQWRNKWEFRQRYENMERKFVSYKKQAYVQNEEKPWKNLDKLTTRLESWRIRRTKKEVLPELPDKIYHNAYVEMEGRQKQAYERLRKESIQEWRSVSREELRTRLISAQQVMQRLMEVADGFIRNRFEGESKVEYLPSAKEEWIAKQLPDLIERQGKKVIIFSLWVPPIPKLAERFIKYNALQIYGAVKEGEARDACDLFSKSDNHPLLVCQLQKKGIEFLPKRDLVEFFINRAWQAAINFQAEDRAHRWGTHGGVDVWKLLCKDSVDERRYQVIKGREQTIAEVVKSGKFLEVV